MSLEIERTEFLGWKDAYRLRLGEAEMVVVTEIGPRILGLSVAGGPNLLYVDQATAGKGQGDTEWHIYGGARIWVAPESQDTYAPDNSPCEVEVSDGVFTALAPTAERTQLQKRLTVSGQGDRFVLEMGVTNRGNVLYSGAVWAIACVVPTGALAFPWGRGGTWDQKKICYWNCWMEHTSDVTSSQYRPGPDMFRIVPTGEEGKVGTAAPEGWIAYCRDEATFIKQHCVIPNANYPDDNCSQQMYTCPDFIEMETLTPMTIFYPGEEIVHHEVWTVTAEAVDSADGEALRKLLA